MSFEPISLFFVAYHHEVLVFCFVLHKDVFDHMFHESFVMTYLSDLLYHPLYLKDRTQLLIIFAIFNEFYSECLHEKTLIFSKIRLSTNVNGLQLNKMTFQSHLELPFSFHEHQCYRTVSITNHSIFEQKRKEQKFIQKYSR